ncbi:MAG: dTDP-4-dehydrorhamnose 3,5-epimerase [Dongiaceae bacterium]
MRIEETDIPDIKLLRLRRFGDGRGYFCELFSDRAFAATGIGGTFVQDNLSLSRETGTIRGLHYQLPPAAQAKLVTVIRGAIYDVAMDIRRGSPTFGRHYGARLSADDSAFIHVPVGFAHGFQTLEADTQVFYKVSAPYSPAHERGLIWCDPALAIAWPIAGDRVTLSDRDRNWPRLAEATDLF